MAFALPGTFYVPVMGGGRFDVLLPSRVYSMVNVNGTGYAYDSTGALGVGLRSDARSGRSIHHRSHRALLDSCLRRQRWSPHSVRHLPPHGPVACSAVRGASISHREWPDNGCERAENDGSDEGIPDCYRPGIGGQGHAVWLDGEQQTIVQFNKVPEYDGDVWQVQYLLQFYPGRRPQPFVWHEIKLEVHSKETLRGNQIVDFGQGSVGFYRQ